MTSNGLMALILRYFTQFGSFRAHCVKWLKFTFAVSSPDEFLVCNFNIGYDRYASVVLAHVVAPLSFATTAVSTDLDVTRQMNTNGP